MAEELVLRDDHDAVTVLTLNRPHRRNAWTIPLQRTYYGLLQDCVANPSVRVIVLHASSYLLPLIGMSRATELLVSGRTFTTDEAAGFGLVHQLVPAEELLDGVLEYATDLAVNCSPGAVSTIKGQLRDSYAHGFTDTVEEAERLERAALSSADFRVYEAISCRLRCSTSSGSVIPVPGFVATTAHNRSPSTSSG